MGVRLMLVDDHYMTRLGLRTFLETQLGLEVIGEAEDGAAAVEKALTLKPDIVIVDFGLPGWDGAEVTRQILKSAPQVKIIAYSMYADRKHVREMFLAGASAYLTKDSPYEELIPAVQAVMTDQRYLSARIADLVVSEFLRRPRESEPADESILTTREREVLKLLAEGMTTRRIGAALNISEKTVETHRRQIMGKLNLHSVAELTKYAIREGLSAL